MHRQYNNRIMRPITKWWLSVIVCSLSYNILVCQANLARTYKLLYDGGLKVTASYTLYKTASNIRCASTCTGKPRCWLYTWDTTSKECQLLDFLNTVVSTGAAPPTLRTYYVDSIDGRKIIKTSSTSSWTQSNDTCANMGGRLFIPEDNTYCHILNHVFGEDLLYIGMWRYPSDITVWYNMEGLTTFPHPNWGPGQPNNYFGSQFYVGCHKGNADDVSNNYNDHGICEI
ncbi:hypothetical protein SK128_020064 [Halocaridina rubra]|uniref:Apple domain-containing protein n=1 Tax=Halocaridina rubra TaxID=373956 RepID=A0AAN8WFY2_HALRR